MRLIDADALIDKTDDRYSLHEIGRRERDDIVDALEYAPTIQPDIVRCKDCEHRYVEGDNVRYNTCELNHNNVQSDDWYCADAERREVTT